MQSPQLSEDEIAALYERAVAGEFVNHLAREIGMHWSTLYRILSRRYGFLPNKNWLRETTLTLPTDQFELGYLAGIIDGEGSIMHPGRTEYWQIKVNMTDEPVIRWLASMGGIFSVRPPDKPGRKEQYAWVLARQADVRLFLTTMTPLLRVKRAKAEEALASLVRRYGPLDAS
jgi:hypothetical protein